MSSAAEVPQVVDLGNDVPTTRPRLRVLPGPPAGGASPDDAQLELWSRRLVLAVCEVVGGRRAVAQLVPWTDPSVYCAVHRQLRRLRLAFPSSTDQLSVGSTHVFRVGAASAEVTARLDHRGRSRALALRLERRHDRWMCTALELV